ncbi:uncharacterized protein LOC131856277 [Cryptomeria japonica]|uniref:uncharacterized protein LOC131856277 n=1 Tax=Cryptomeria japonica TaxID=3369 RepID=UPI0027DAADAE|nr:uncharacterized protein LOC131856277 [Cryptomeria japonica]
MELPESLGKLPLLEELYLDGCNRLKQLPVGFGNLKALAVLNLHSCESLEELPMDFVNLSSLQYLCLDYCKSLQDLPYNFDKLTSLKYLNLRYCFELARLPERLGNLQSLTEIYFSSCTKLSSLPQSLGGLPSLLMSNMSFERCSALTELPEETSWLLGMTSISFEDCSRLKRIPTQFSKLTCLKGLFLGGCESIEELFSDFLGLDVLRTLGMSRCRSLSSLPQGFGKLKSLQILNLSECDKLKELCGDFHCLGALKELCLSGCRSLTKLPNYFGQLRCLEKADLSGCSNLAKLSDDFHTLPSLIRLNLSNCKRLAKEWMDCVGATQSLCYVDISGSEGMTQRWMEMQREKEDWHLVVVTQSSSKGIEGTLWTFLLEKIIWKIFCKGGLLTDALQRLFFSSSLPSHARLILITQGSPIIPEKWRSVQSNLERLEYNTKAAAIIYIGGEFNALPSELADRIVAHSPFDSFMVYFGDVLPESFYYSPGVFGSTIVGVERTTIKYLSTWEDISYINNEVEFLTRNPRESNVELLRKLCLAEHNDFLLHNDETLNVKDLERKVVLLLRHYSSHEQYLALKDVYQKLQWSSDYQAEVIWFPPTGPDGDPEECERAVTSAPWPMVPKPWLINEHHWMTDCVGYGNGLVVVDEKGSISHKDAMSMIVRWGIKAYPFSERREEELRKAEWKDYFKLNSQSGMDFIFQHCEFFQLRAKEAINHGQIIFLCVGKIDKMLELLPKLNDTLTKLENVIQVFYVGDEYLSV